MANKRFGLGMLVMVMVLVFGMAVTGCVHDPDHGGQWAQINETLPNVEMTGDWTALNVEFDGNAIELSRPSGTAGSLDGVWTGTHDGTSIVVTFTGTNWITRDTAGNEMARGTVTISGSNVSITITHLMVSGGAPGEGEVPPGADGAPEDADGPDFDVEHPGSGAKNMVDYLTFPIMLGTLATEVTRHEIELQNNDGHRDPNLCEHSFYFPVPGDLYAGTAYIFGGQVSVPARAGGLDGGRRVPGGDLVQSGNACQRPSAIRVYRGA